MAVLKSPRNTSNKKRWAHLYKKSSTPSLYMLGMLNSKRLRNNLISSISQAYTATTTSFYVGLPSSSQVKLPLYNVLLITRHMSQFSQYGLSQLHLIRFYYILHFSVYVTCANQTTGKNVDILRFYSNYYIRGHVPSNL